jgi:MinD-like ATPase involved in chromosome partitioning or flagellar assembly
MNERDEFLRDRLRPGQPEGPTADPPDPQPRDPRTAPPPVSHPVSPTVPPPVSPRPAPPRAPAGPRPPPRQPAAPPQPRRQTPAPPPLNQQAAPPPPRPGPLAPPPQPGPPPGGPRSTVPPPPGAWPDAAFSPVRSTAAGPADSGWRRIVRIATFGLVKLGPSATQREQAQLEAAIRTVLQGTHKVGVLGKGGVGKTSVAASIGSILAELRQQDRVVAIDADTAFGRLSSRIDPAAKGSFWELTADKNLRSFSDLIARVGRNSAGLHVLGGEPAAGPRRVLDPAIYREAALRLDRHFTISIIDCGSAMDAPVTQEVLRDLDALIVVSSPWADGASAAAKTMEWLSDQGLRGLLQRSVVVLNDSDGHADKRTRSLLAREFSDHGRPVVEVPFDAHLRPGGVIDVSHEMAAPTRQKFLQVAAMVIGYFGSPRDDVQARAPW